MSRLTALWWRVADSLWFVPALVVLGSIAAAVALVELDSVMDARLAERWPRLFGAGAESSRGLLSAIATSMITVAGVVFSVTLVALSLAASQYSPRVLRTFMSDHPTQIVLGAFVGAFAYSLVVLRTIRESDDNGFVPSLAVLGGIVYALVGIGLLIFFIHHLAKAIQVSTILHRITQATLESIACLFPEALGAADPEGETDRAAARISEWTAVACSQSGYIVSVDEDGLLGYARRCDRLVRMERGVGDFAIRGLPLASLSGEAPVTEADAAALNVLYATDTERTLEQDAVFGIQQIVDIALKALSPGINDRTTAVMCIDRLAEILARLAGQRIESHYRRDEDDGLRVIAIGSSFAGLAALAVESIRDAAEAQPAVLLRLIWALDQAAAATHNPHRLQELAAHSRSIAEAAERGIRAPDARREVVAAARRFAEAVALTGHPGRN